MVTAYASVNSLHRIVAIQAENRDGLIEINSQEVINNPQNYKYMGDNSFELSIQPSVYHTLNANGDWYLNNEVLQASKDDMWQLIKNYRDEREEGGVKLAIDGTDYWFHSDTRSLIKYLFLLFLATIFSNYFQNNISWKTMDNDVVVNLTPQIIINIFFAVMAMGNTVHQIGRNHRSAMNQSNAPLNYNYKTGWPPIYGE
jgi:hypothetical protein